MLLVFRSGVLGLRSARLSRCFAKVLSVLGLLVMTSFGGPIWVVQTSWFGVSSVCYNSTKCCPFYGLVFSFWNAPKRLLFSDSSVGLRSSSRKVLAGKFLTTLSHRASREDCRCLSGTKDILVWVSCSALFRLLSSFFLLSFFCLFLSLSLSWLDLQEQAACSLTTT